MNEQTFVSKINEFLFSATKELCGWLTKMLPRVTDDWWNECVLENLSAVQRAAVEEKGYTRLDQLDLAALLRVTDKSWRDMSLVFRLVYSERKCVKDMIRVRNNWAHCGELPDKDSIIDDIQAIIDFFEVFLVTNIYTKALIEFRTEVENYDFSTVIYKAEVASLGKQDVVTVNSEIKVRSKVYLVGAPEKIGLVQSISDVSGVKKYEVFIDGDFKFFYEGQIKPVDVADVCKWVDLATFQSDLTAYEINNPSAGNLYSLNAARIDFVPYQFRPALKLIKADEPKILIADSVGVGKTIEAGLIIKELEARNELENIVIICPKPLVAERKWELEMKRFDEDFIPLTGGELRQIISDTHRDEEWPTRYSKTIIPYSILDSRIYEGETTKRGRVFGLNDLDPSPHFDLVIIDEAHHIRNGSMDKEKAFAYKCVRYFCEHADAVVMLTATPLQTSDDDLFTLMNLLRPDVIINKGVFDSMMRPNEFIYNCSHAIRLANDGWRETAIAELRNVTATQWGESVTSKNPLYTDILQRLEKEDISREERVKLLTDVESLHSLNTMINRTRRKDIQDFCIRRSYTIETSFTEAQADLHNLLLRFEFDALSKLHNVRSIPFMMSTIRRQASSCIFGLAPYIRSLIERRFEQIIDTLDVDEEEFDLTKEATSALTSLAKQVLEAADNLLEEDPKFDSVLMIIDEKQKQDDNKIILFSTFCHTLAYINRKLKGLGYRVGQIDGSVKDEQRRDLRERFELNKSDPDAIDILLFTEVGSEGLDYQFCNMMINYDLPWNPMRIEQRIGRIDRRGQKSDVVNIYNIITADTVDADIYYRCLQRIGIFERSIGECEEVLGSIGAQIEQIAVDVQLTPEERRQKLEQMADNEVRRMQELDKLENEEKALFGFDLSNYTAAKEIKDAESPWISPENIQKLVERYLKERIGAGQYIIGSGESKNIRLNKDARLLLLEDLRKLSNIKSALKRRWENYLKGTDALHRITFTSEAASKDRKAFFITPMHPLVKQAAKYFAKDETQYIHIVEYSDEIPTGTYYFSIYAWSYAGINPKFRVVPVCDNALVEEDLPYILQNVGNVSTNIVVDGNKWKALEARHLEIWQREKEKYLEELKNTANYKVESVNSNFRNRRRNLEQLIHNSYDEKLIRMYQSQLNTAFEHYQGQVDKINAGLSRADIYFTLIANGIIDIMGDTDE